MCIVKQPVKPLPNSQRDPLLQALLRCFVWLVPRATLAKQFPAECQPELQTLWERWTEQLTDRIWSLRQDAAFAIGDTLEAYPDILWPDFVMSLFPKFYQPLVNSQP